MRKGKKPIGKKLSLGVLITVLIIAAGIRILSVGFRISPPEVKDTHHLIDKEVVISKSGERIFNGCFLRQSNSGLWEVYLRGNAFDRGIATGKLEKDLLAFQEKVFVDQIKRIIPSEFYLKFLRIFIAFFNRNLAAYIPGELKEEIYGTSLSCSHDYDFIGSPYERQLNYHSAHDLGHALQDYMLVGCTSFAAWGDATEDSTLLVGRNFDFYVSDDFAKNKTVTFYAPENGYKFVSVAWAGMSGVVSGMNEKGLTVTINAAKTSIPASSATPISILCREILQYASTIEEARRIAGQFKLFVSESILIGSAIDNSAEIIEKSPDKTGVFTVENNWLVCANHFQSKVFQDDKSNLENIRTSDSPYRQQRMEELIREHIPLNPLKTAGILRDRQGLGGKDAGLGNEKAINQLIAHHSVIFKPVRKQIWVSTHPWQLGQYVCYDLNVVFANPDFSSEIKIDGLTIPADTFLRTKDYRDFILKRNLKYKGEEDIHIIYSAAIIDRRYAAASKDWRKCGLVQP
jgi:predicted choloylglycine hydrolase